MLKTPSLLFIGSVVALSHLGCSSKTSTSDGLDSESAALVDDNTDTDDTEDAVMGGVEEPLSGATEGGEVNITADVATVAEAGRANPGIYFQPAGCIVSTRADNVVTHTFTNCTGPYGFVSYNGVITSTWSKTASGVQVVHATTGFRVNGATIDHTATIAYSKDAGIYTRTRNGSTSGTTASGKPITHTADYVLTYDPADKCITRNGSSTTTIGGRSFSRSITGWVRCGVGDLGCPTGGEVKLVRARLNLVLDFPGGALVDITIDGKKFRRPLFCKA